MTTDEELLEDDNELWPGMMGVTVYIPMKYRHDLQLAERYENAYANKLDRVAKEFDTCLRAQLQDPHLDHLTGHFRERDVMLWTDGAYTIDHNQLRQYLHDKGYSVSHIGFYYGPVIG